MTKPKLISITTNCIGFSDALLARMDMLNA